MPGIKLQELLREHRSHAEQSAYLLVTAAVRIDELEHEAAEWREWCTKVAHAVGFCEDINDIGKSAAEASRQTGSNAIRRTVLGRLHERNAERNAALAKLETT